MTTIADLRGLRCLPVTHRTSRVRAASVNYNASFAHIEVPQGRTLHRTARQLVLPKSG
jgi:hypothetical protein